MITNETALKILDVLEDVVDALDAVADYNDHSHINQGISAIREELSSLPSPDFHTPKEGFGGQF